MHALQNKVAEKWTVLKCVVISTKKKKKTEQNSYLTFKQIKLELFLCT